ncbi:MAG: hypothetical protein KA759_07820 [Zoogloea sp.]|jgi:hypothetical protein|nr:hypothetical protein [Zoogloea ramigera]MBP7626952.1 hypothetical protein [Zoogloea sp.]
MLTPKKLMTAVNRFFEKQKGELSFASRNFGWGAEAALCVRGRQPHAAAAKARMTSTPASSAADGRVGVYPGESHQTSPYEGV